MDAMRNVASMAKSSDFKRTVRELKNKVYNYSEIEQMVRRRCRAIRSRNYSHESAILSAHAPTFSAGTRMHVQRQFASP